ncbi:hypothetical protein ABC347_01550 [Sphingomonas sp. 1P06PA]|uniref:hypothetical protein n=1 Tax=Sphingomonas sp. 1P06PA TaxID=554121 RepID=UPI0039A71B00
MQQWRPMGEMWFSGNGEQAAGPPGIKGMKQMVGRAGIGLAVLLLLGLGGQASAADKPGARPKILSDLVGCRALTDAAERLACYDRGVAALDTAEQAKDVVVVDRAQVRQARRSLFGLSLPSLKIFGNSDDGKEAEAFKEIETTIKSASYNGQTQRWTIVLEDGARWTQTETKRFRRDPKPGMKIKIREALMGSYFANVGEQQATRMQRIN